MKTVNTPFWIYWCNYYLYYQGLEEVLNKRKQRFRPKPQISQKQNRNSNRKYCALRNTVFGGQKQKFKLQKKILTETEKWCLSDREYSYFDKKKDKNRK